jgi:DNA-directed RNA polymerase specialized sigma subunit
MTSYTVTATRDGNWWSLIATDVDGREVASQSRRLDQADAAIRDAIALVLDVDKDSFDVDVIPTLDKDEVSEETLELLDLRRQLSELSERSRRLTPQAVAELRGAGLTVRDVAGLLGVTPSRVSQIEHESPMARSAS